MQLKDQHILVAGGSSGIGLEVARAALAQGARVSILGRDATRLSQAASQLGAVQTVAADVANEAALDRALAELPPPDHVYVAAGGFVGGPVLEGTMAAYRAALDSRLWGSVHLVRALAPRMQPSTASFVFTGAVSTDRPAKGAWATAVATAAAEQLARALALELAPMRFNAIAPGWTDTPMWDALLGATKASTFATVAQQLPVRRLATAADAAQGVLLLMSNPSITGEVLHVDGGHRLV